MHSLELVNRYFEREARRFDAIYDRSKPLHERLGDAVFRRVILERYSLVVNSMGAEGSSVLDVGCGPGRYGIELARRGARRVVGVDAAQAMIDLAREAASRLAEGGACEWVRSDFLSFQTHSRFDTVIAMGYFDYLEDPFAHLKKMIELAQGRVYASFPKRWTFRTGLRKLRFLVARGFVRFYSRAQILSLFRMLGDLQFLSLVDLGRDIVAIYDAGAACRPRPST